MGGGKGGEESGEGRVRREGGVRRGGEWGGRGEEERVVPAILLLRLLFPFLCRHSVGAAEGFECFQGVRMFTYT